MDFLDLGWVGDLDFGSLPAGGHVRLYSRFYRKGYRW